jgi:AcrR family transcriptional regulator
MALYSMYSHPAKYDADVAPRPYRSARRASAAEETRRAILDAALALLEAKGYAQATVAEVAARADVSVNTVYASVGGKPQLLVGLIQDASSGADIESAVARIEEESDASEVIAALARGTGAVFRANAWLLGELYDNARADPAIAEVIAEAEAAYVARVARAAARLDELGALQPAVSESDAADVLWFYFGFRPWQALRARGWTWERAEGWLVEQASRATLDR